MIHGKVVQDMTERFHRHQTDFDKAIILNLLYVSEEVFQTAFEV